MAKKEESTLSGYVRESSKIYGGSILVFGDLHLSAIYEGTHVNYLQECYENLDTILGLVKEKKPSAVIFTGDIVGVNERNIKDHQFLMRVIMFFGMLYNLTKGNVYSVKGNHDLGEFTDFDFLIGLGYLKNPSYLDYYGNKGDNTPEIRFHFVNYGEESYPLELAYVEEECTSNIVIGHADFYIDGVTNWYSSKNNRVELKALSNFLGVDMVISGHIHNPSDEMLYATMSDGNSIGLFYLGSPSRTSERIDCCWYMTFEYSELDNSTNYYASLFDMRPASEVFHPKEDYDYEEEETTESRDTKVLDEIVREIIDSRLATGDIFKQIDNIPADEDCKDLAKSYLRKFIDTNK